MRTEQPARSRSRSRRRKKGTTERAAARPRRNPMEEMLEKARISGEKARIWPLRNSNVLIFWENAAAKRLQNVLNSPPQRTEKPETQAKRRHAGTNRNKNFLRLSCAGHTYLREFRYTSRLPLRPGANAHFSDCGSNAAVPIGEAGGGDPSAWRLGANTYLEGGGRVCVSFSSAAALHPGVCSCRKPDK